jgi:hypothetical protein
LLHCYEVFIASSVLPTLSSWLSSVQTNSTELPHYGKGTFSLVQNKQHCTSQDEFARSVLCVLMWRRVMFTQHMLTEHIDNNKRHVQMMLRRRARHPAVDACSSRLLCSCPPFSTAAAWTRMLS